jgi:HTH-type transcriptional regulator/antitoxin MqsA
MDVHDKNLSKIRAKFADERGAIKKRNNLLSGEEILKIRKQLGLTQRGAAELFGGGANAFSKYENEEIVQTVAMDKLIRHVAHQGEFAIHLLKNIYALKTKPENAFEA